VESNPGRLSALCTYKDVIMVISSMILMMFMSSTKALEKQFILFRFTESGYPTSGHTKLSTETN